MARAQADISSPFTFVKGLLTETSKLNEPDNSASDIKNVVVGIDGVARRRKGLQTEDLGTLIDVNSVGSIDGKAVHAMEWKNVNGNAQINFEIIQIGTDLHFFSWDSAVMSQNFIGSVSFSAACVSTSSAALQPCQASATALGLVVVNLYADPFIVIYNQRVSPAEFILKKLVLKARDFIGVPDGLRVDENPTNLTELHFYNLMNQGWVEPGDSGLGDNSGTGSQGGDTSQPGAPTTIESNNFSELVIP